MELPGLPKHVFNVPYGGQYNLWDVSTIQKGIKTWQEIASGGNCDGWNGKNSYC